MSELCKKCKCNCVLVEEECIYENTSLTAQSKLLYKNGHVFKKVHLLELSRCIGQDCIDELCAAKNAAIVQATEEGKSWKECIESRWLLILDSELFKCMYSAFVEYHISLCGNISYSGEGMIEVDRRLENNVGVTRQVNGATLKNYQDKLKGVAKQFEALFVKEFDCINHLFSCYQEACNPCEVKEVKGKLSFAKPEREALSGFIKK